MKNLAKTLIYLLPTTFYLLPPSVYADYDLNTALHLIQTEKVADKFPNLSVIVSTVLPNIYIISGLILLFISFGAGFTILSSGGNPEKTEKGSQALKGAIIGFIIIFASYWIVQIIEVITGVKIITNPTWTP